MDGVDQQCAEGWLTKIVGMAQPSVEDAAAAMGISLGAMRAVLVIGTACVVGAGTAVAGAIGFVGLVVPHALRLVGGSEHRWLLTASAITGAGFMVAADALARTVVAPTELPVGVVTALIGVPVFLWLLLRSEELR